MSRFAQALRDHRYDDAYEMMSLEYRQQVPYEQFRHYAETHAAEVNETAQAVDSIQAPIEQEATVTYGDNEELHLVNEDGKWKVSSNVVDYYSQATPRDALLAFVRAIEHKRYDVVIALAPRADRERMTAEQIQQSWEGPEREDIQRLAATLRDNLDRPIEVTGNHATMTYAQRFSVQFVREDGLWKIEDPD